jgi:uncharacterized damage-inducible protein DinB
LAPRYNGDDEQLNEDADLNADIETYSYYLRKQITSIRDHLRGLSDEQINRVPPVEGANSAFVTGTHVLGNARAWVLGIACGQPIVRDRPAEFVSTGSAEDFDRGAMAVCAEIQEALSQLDTSDLDRRFKPPQELWGAGEVQEVSRRIALADVLEHASLHLGHLQITVQLLEQRPV